MFRLVMDTNILISALGWKGNERKILEGCILGKFQLVESLELLEELVNVLKRPKFNFIPAEKKAELFKCLVEICEIVYPNIKLDIIKEDIMDNRVLECALKGDVNYVITGDDHLLRLKKFRSIKIVSAVEFLGK